MKKIGVAVVLVLVLGGILWVLSKNEIPTVPSQVYSSEKLGFSFEYPEGYFISETDQSTGEREHYSIVVFEDTPFNRSLVAGEVIDTDAPPTITITLFQNNLDNYTARSFVEGTSFSNFKLSDSNLTEVTIDEEPGLRYKADGLWQSNNVVVAKPQFVYMFTGFYNSPEDEIVGVFEDILKTVKFSPRTPTSADNAPEGSIHNLPVPEAVSAVKRLAAETYKINEGEIIVMSAKEKDWPNACLGLPPTEELCAEVITPGYEVIVLAGGKEHVYHTNADGSSIRLLEYR